MTRPSALWRVAIVALAVIAVACTQSEDGATSPREAAIETIAPTAEPTTAPTAPPTPKPTQPRTQRPTVPPPPPPTPTPDNRLCKTHAGANPWGYDFCFPGTLIYAPSSDFCGYFPCIGNFWNGNGYVIQCSDGTFGKSGGIRGSCSHHGGNASPLYSH